MPPKRLLAASCQPWRVREEYIRRQSIGCCSFKTSFVDFSLPWELSASKEWEEENELVKEPRGVVTDAGGELEGPCQGR